MVQIESAQQPTQQGIIPLEWITVKQACAYAHMGLTCLYSHLDFNGGGVKTALIRRRGATNGKRLVNLDSLRGLIEGSVEIPACSPKS